jgi:hypothetical protein
MRNWSLFQHFQQGFLLGALGRRLGLGDVEIRERESELLYNWRFTASQFVSATSPLIFFQLNPCSHSLYVTSSLTRGCSPSSAQIFSGPSLAGLITIFYCLRFETPSTWRARSPYLYPPGTGWPSYTPRHWVPFSSPPANLSMSSGRRSFHFLSWQTGERVILLLRLGNALRLLDTQEARVGTTLPEIVVFISYENYKKLFNLDLNWTRARVVCASA